MIHYHGNIEVQSPSLAWEVRGNFSEGSLNVEQLGRFVWVKVRMGDKGWCHEFSGRGNTISSLTEVWCVLRSRRRKHADTGDLNNDVQCPKTEPWSEICDLREQERRIPWQRDKQTGTWEWQYNDKESMRKHRRTLNSWMRWKGKEREKGRGGRKNNVVRTFEEVTSQNIRKS